MLYILCSTYVVYLIRYKYVSAAFVWSPTPSFKRCRTCPSNWGIQWYFCITSAESFASLRWTGRCLSVWHNGASAKQQQHQCPPHCPGFEQILCYLEELTQRFQETEDGDRDGDHTFPCTGRYWAHIILYLFALTWVFFSTSWDSFESIVVPFVKSVLAFLNWIHVIIKGTGLTTHPNLKIS